MNGCAILNTNKEIMSLEVQTDYFCPGADGIHTLLTVAKPICMDLPCDSQQILKITFWPSPQVTWLPLEGVAVGGMATGQTLLTITTAAKSPQNILGLVVGHVSTMETRETEDSDSQTYLRMSGLE